MNGTQPQVKARRQLAFAGLGLTTIAIIVTILLRLSGLATLQPHSLRAGADVTPQPSPSALAEADSRDTLRFLLRRVKSDPEDFLAQGMLASALLQKVRETGSADYLERAKQAAAASLASVPAVRNRGGLSAQARVAMAEHDFVAARDGGLRLTQLDPGGLNSWGVLTDAYLELGDYAKADAAIQRMRSLGGETAETEIRFGRLLFLQGDSESAKKHLFRALAFALNIPVPPRETVAWCRWQLGELAFSTGDLASAEQRYRESLATYPGYVQALASLGRVLAARADLPGAIAAYEEATHRFPDPTFIAALGDLYSIAGQENLAETQYQLVEQIGHLSALNGIRYNRQLATFYADHDRNGEAAYEDALREYAQRRDIYGADTLAWTALKSGHLAEAQRMMSAALRLSTRDAKLFFHAGMIAKASHHPTEGRENLRRALALNAAFDPLQSRIAREALAN